MLPLLFIAGSIFIGGSGAVIGACGVADMKEAKRRAKKAADRYQKALLEFNREFATINSLAVGYGALQLRVIDTVVMRMTRYIKKSGQKVSDKDRELLMGLETKIAELRKFQNSAISLGEGAAGGAKLAGAALTAYFGTTAAVAAFGTASTGTAIGGLSGVAATNATLAWLGGGSLAAGGGGMALGSTVLTGLVAAPVLFLGGLFLGKKGEEAITAAAKFEADVDKEIAAMDRQREALKWVKARFDELTKIIEGVEQRATVALDNLENKLFGHFNKAAKFREAMILVRAVAEIVQTPVLDPDCPHVFQLSKDGTNIAAKYKNYSSESTKRSVAV